MILLLTNVWFFSHVLSYHSNVFPWPMTQSLMVCPSVPGTINQSLHWDLSHVWWKDGQLYEHTDAEEDDDKPWVVSQVTTKSQSFVKLLTHRILQGVVEIPKCWIEWISGAHKIWVARSIHIWIPSPYKEPTLKGPPIHSPQADRMDRDVKIMCDPVDIVQQNPDGFGFEILFIPTANLWTPPNTRLCLYPLSPWKWIVKHIGHCLRVLTHYPRHH